MTNKSSNNIINNDTISDNVVVESDVPPRYLFVDSMADNASLKLK